MFDLYIADSLIQPTILLHNDNIINDDVTGSVGDDPKNHTTYDDFDQQGEFPVVNDDKHTTCDFIL